MIKNKIIGSIIMLFLAQGAQAVDLVQGQQAIDQFLAQHEVSSTSVYCRTDIKTPECRTLMRYVKKDTKRPVRSFQMAFTAPFRQAGGTEFYLESESNPNIYNRWTDFIVDGKVIIDGGSAEQVKLQSCKIVIKNIKLGTTTGDLTFDKKMASLIGVKPSANDPNVIEHVKLLYPAFKP